MTPSRTRIPWAMTSGPMPSPGTTAIRNGIASAYREAPGRKFWRPSPIPLHSVDRGDCAERGAGEDATPPPRSPLIAPHLLGHLGIRRAGLPRSARRWYRRPGVGLSAPTLASSSGGGSFRDLDQAVEHLPGAAAVQRLLGDLNGLGPIVGSTGGQDRRGRVQENHVAAWPGLSLQDLDQQGRVLRRRAALQRMGAGAREAKIPGVELKVFNRAVAQLKDA